MRILKSIAAISAAGAMALSLAACGGGNAGNAGNGGNGSDQGGGGNTENVKVGIALPQKTSENWVEAEGFFQETCKEKKLDCTLQFANGGVAEQQNQVDAMITSGVKVLIIGALDGTSLGTQLQKAKDDGIAVIAYDRLLMDTENVDNYVAYDSYQVGVKQGEALLEGLKKQKGDGPYTIELVAGSNDDSNTSRFFEGGMSVLQPKIDDGTITVGSGQTKQSQAATQGWDPKNAQSRMDAILSQNYPGDKVPDGILSPNDTLARAVLTSVQQAGKEQPVVTGQDSEIESLKWIMEGKQYSTISKPTLPLVQASVDLAIKLASGEKDLKELNGIQVSTDQSNNNTKDVPSFLLEPIVATKENAKEVYKDEPKKLEAVNSVG
uniref:substrate-binding domain-containing protein n=1 Tax=Tessaracoccus timonensis TaxID=2161816 RepID=UPI000D55326E|nr:sugar-binding protein [Tessaracoccus timonensis]